MRREGDQVYRLENVDVRQLLELLATVYEKSDYTDIVLDFKAQRVAIEPPFDLTEAGEKFQPFLDRPEIDDPDGSVDEVKLNDEIFKLLTTRKA